MLRPFILILPILTATTTLVAQDPADTAECSLRIEPRRFDFAGVRSAGLMYMPSSLSLAVARPASVTKEPEYRATPRYATLTLGSDGRATRVIAVDEPDGAEAHVFIDLDGDGELGDDNDGVWENASVSEGGSTNYQGTFIFRIGWQSGADADSTGEYGLNFYYSPDRDRLNYYTAAARVGDLEIGGKSYKVTLMENDGDARFDKRFDRRGVSVVGQQTKPVWLGLDGDRFDARGTFPFRGMNYLADISDDGSHVALAPTFKVLKAPPPAPEGPQLLKVGVEAPDFVAMRFNDGEAATPFRLADFRGRKIVVIDMWATWCSPCMASLPHLSKIHDSVQGQDVEVIALNVFDDEKAYLKLLAARREELHMTFARDPAGRESEASFAKRDYNVRGIPATFVIDKDGKVAAAISGYEAGDTRVADALAALGVKVD